MLDVILVHAYPLDSRLWEPQLIAAPKGLRLRAIDLPGFGRAPSPPLPNSVDVMAEAIHEAAKGLKRFALVGVSMGGYAALAYWRKYGNEGRIAGLVLSDTKAAPDAAEGKADRNGTIALLHAQGVSALAVKMLPRLLSPNAEEGARRELRAIMESQRVETVIAATEALRDRPDSTDLLRSIEVPTLVVGGELDAVTPPDVMGAMAKQLPQATHKVIPKAGHLPNWERPTAFNEVVFPFLEALPVAV